MDIEMLRTFVEVHRTRHFGKAAKNLCVTQAAVSARVRQMEELLGIRLFTRDRNNIQLTAAGQRLLRHAENMLTTWNRARMDIAVADEAQVPIVVGAVPSLWDIFVGDWIRAVYAGEKHVALTGEALPAETLLQRLLDGTVDIAFIYDAPTDPALVAVKTIPVNLVLVSSQSRQYVNAALAENYIYVEWGTSFAVAHSNYFPDAPAPSMRISLGRIALELLMQTGGAAFLPEPMVSRAIRRRELYRVKGAPEIERIAHAVLQRENGHDRQELVLDLLKLCD